MPAPPWCTVTQQRGKRDPCDAYCLSFGWNGHRLPRYPHLYYPHPKTRPNQGLIEAYLDLILGRDGGGIEGGILEDHEILTGAFCGMFEVYLDLQSTPNGSPHTLFMWGKPATILSLLWRSRQPLQPLIRYKRTRLAVAR